ncbi:MAG: tetratricopeptide repeat protein [Panacagrimonas sp.]
MSADPALGDAPERADEFQRIVPQRIDVAASGPSPYSQEPPSRITGARFALGLGAILLIGGLSFRFLPPLLAPAPKSDTATATKAAQRAAPTETPDTPAAPTATSAAWDDPALLQARAAAQDARSRFEAAVKRLRDSGVERWGAAALAAAQQQADQAAAAFEAKDFAAARSAYETAATAVETLVGEIPTRVAAALADGTQALEAGDKTRAQAAYELALVLEPGNALATRGLQRVASFDQVRARILSAQRLEQAGDVVAARSAWASVLQLDADSALAKEALTRLDQQARDLEFARVMAQAIAALDRSALDEAASQLGRAQTVRAADPALTQARARLAEAQRGQSLRSLEAEAAAQVTAENWDAAVASYQAALKLDNSLAFAREGLALAEPRAALAQRLQDYINRPSRLASSAVAALARADLQQARGIGDAGPRLREQMQKLELTMTQATQPVNVQLRSDGYTEVTLYKVGSFGRFSLHALTLKPGRYVAVGTRSGYRDVRREFEVPAGATSFDLDLRCEEPL